LEGIEPSADVLMLLKREDYFRMREADVLASLSSTAAAAEFPESPFEHWIVH
jgi:hypothetical protein